LQALDLLARDEQTRVIVLVSKPPAPEVARDVLAKARAIAKPVVVYFLGQPVTRRRLGNLRFALNLEDAAELAVSAEQSEEAYEKAQVHFQGLSDGYLRGLFSGGTLAYEMMLGLQGIVAPLFSNVPLRPEQQLENPIRSQGHAILDLGADEFTQGRLHPMMDNTLRIRRLRQEVADSEVGLVVMDVVLGEGAHPDPASELAPAIAGVRGDRQVDVAVLLVGTEDDPQDLSEQREQFEQAGAEVYESSVALLADIARSVAPAVEQAAFRPISTDVFDRPLAAINVGLESFYDSMIAQNAEAVHVAWRPPAGGNEKMMALLAKLKSN
jgi:FdrA protein